MFSEPSKLLFDIKAGDTNGIREFSVAGFFYLRSKIILWLCKGDRPILSPIDPPLHVCRPLSKVFTLIDLDRPSLVGFPYIYIVYCVYT